MDCNKAEEGLKTTPCSECALNALAIDEPLEYARLYLEGNMQMWGGCGRFSGIMVKYHLMQPSPQHSCGEGNQSTITC
ncbi:MAG: hypothetical protein K2N73_00350 [Lachnospiraceae bacterium]|nr:hypothetical protein [Lachnospiraceae bacterium]